MIDSEYNKRLFAKGLRKSFHLSRFKWLEKIINKYSIKTNSVLELGCFDGWSIDYIKPKPKSYDGYDANWENGLDIAKLKYNNFENYYFHECESPSLFNSENKYYDLSVSLETLEHIPVEMLDDYLFKISKCTSGYFIVTVPNEKGILFLLKYLLKRTVYGGYDEYTFREIVNATLGRMNLVERDQHKGFDYAQLKLQLAEYLDLIEESGIPFSRLPFWMNTQIGFLFKSKEQL
jgi:hypothetical protein